MPDLLRTGSWLFREDMAPLIGLLFVEGNKGTRSAAAEAEKFEPSLKLDIHYIHHSLLHALTLLFLCALVL